MDVPAFLCAVVDNPVSDATVTDIPAITDNATQIASEVATDFVDKFLNTDLINNILPQYAEAFAIGFALTTLLMLLTFGVFKAFSLVRID